jgi:hypothetical protein
VTAPRVDRRVDRRPRPRRWIADPVVPAILFAAGALVAAGAGAVLTWALVGGLAGYTLSGSV